MPVLKKRTRVFDFTYPALSPSSGSVEFTFNHDLNSTKVQVEILVLHSGGSWFKIKDRVYGLAGANTNYYLDNVYMPSASQAKAAVFYGPNGGSTAPAKAYITTLE